MRGIRLNIPYVSQWEAFATEERDCGPACVTAFIRALGDKETRVDTVSRKIPNFVGTRRSTSPGENRQVAARFNLIFSPEILDRGNKSFEKFLDDRRGLIALVNHEALPVRAPTPTPVGGHFIVVHGYDDDFYYYDDPNFPPAPPGQTHRGENIRIPKQALRDAMRGGVIKDFNHSNQALVLQGSQRLTVFKESGTAPKGVAEGKRSAAPEAFFARTHALEGQVVTNQGKGMSNASVRLIAPYPALMPAPGAVLAMPRGSLVWDMQVTDVEGDIRDVYEEIGDPAIPWPRFVEAVAERNRHLVEDGYRLSREKRYLFPRLSESYDWIGLSAPADEATTVLDLWKRAVLQRDLSLPYEPFEETFLAVNQLTPGTRTLTPGERYRIPERIEGRWTVAWTREIKGIEGTLDDVYNLHIVPELQEMSRETFRREAIAHNPALASRDRFYRSKKYILPEREPESLVYVSTWSNDDGHFRLNFIPPGRYTLEVAGADFQTVRQEIEVPTEGPVEVEVARRATVGKSGQFIQRGRDAHTGQFVLGNSPFRFVGGNTPGIIHWGHGFHGTHRDDLAKHLDLFRNDFGGRVLRFFIAHDALPSLSQMDDYLNRMDELLRELDARDLYAIPVFTDFHSDRGHVTPGDVERFYTLRLHVNVLALDWFQGGWRENYKPFVERIVDRFKGHPRIMAWELGNELRALADPHTPRPDVFRAWVKEVTGLIRAIDSNHMIASGCINTGNTGAGESVADLVAFNRDLGLDFLVAHIYPDDGGPEIERAEREAEAARHLGLPFVLEEFALNPEGRRADVTREALERWFHPERGADGVLQWGFLGVHDNGDGGGHNGLRPNHGDFGAVLQQFKAFA